MTKIDFVFFLSFLFLVATGICSLDQSLSFIQLANTRNYREDWWDQLCRNLVVQPACRSRFPILLLKRRTNLTRRNINRTGTMFHSFQSHSWTDWIFTKLEDNTVMTRNYQYIIWRPSSCGRKYGWFQAGEAYSKRLRVLFFFLNIFMDSIQQMPQDVLHCLSPGCVRYIIYYIAHVHRAYAIVRIPSGFSEYIWLKTKIVLNQDKRHRNSYIWSPIN